jgi:hypothetical protein
VIPKPGPTFSRKKLWRYWTAEKGLRFPKNRIISKRKFLRLFNEFRESFPSNPVVIDVPNLACWDEQLIFNDAGLSFWSM